MNILIYLIILTSTIFYLRRKPLISPANLLFIYITAAIIIGNILLPVSLITDNVTVDSDMASSLSLYFYLSVTAFFIMLTAFWLAGKIVRFQPTLGFLRNTKLVPHRLFTICLIYYAVGASILFLTFHATNTIPLFDNVFDVKYFRHNLSAYLPYRPFYVLSLDLISLSSLFVLFLSTSAFSNRQYVKASLYFFVSLVMIFTCLLTGKRGETIMPLFVILGALTFAGRIKLKYLLISTFLLFIGIVIIASGLDLRDIINTIRGGDNGRIVAQRPSDNNKDSLDLHDQDRPEKKYTENKFHLSASKKRWILSGPWANIIERVTNSLFVELREGGRLLNNFKGHGLFLGKTYLAGLISLIPTRYSSFKDQYVIGRVSLRLFGGDPDIGGGPQVGYVAESYINYGSAGVFLVPFLFGLFLYIFDYSYLQICKSDAASKDKVFFMIFVFLILLTARGFYTNGSGAFQALLVKTILCVPIYYVTVIHSMPKKHKANGI